MSSSSSEEEMDEAFRESAGCDYITKMVAVPSKFETEKSTGHDRHKPYAAPQSSKGTTNDDDGTDQLKETSFEKFLAKRLACRLDEVIKIVERKNVISALSDVTSPGCGIRLFSGSPKVTHLLETTCEQCLPPQKRHIAENNVDYNERAEEAAVSHQWVKDASNTSFWKDNKKPRVMSTKVVKHLSNGGVECIPTSL